MQFLIHVTWTAENMNQLAARFVSATENGDELPNGVERPPTIGPLRVRVSRSFPLR